MLDLFKNAFHLSNDLACMFESDSGVIRFVNANFEKDLLAGNPISHQSRAVDLLLVENDRVYFKESLEKLKTEKTVHEFEVMETRREGQESVFVRWTLTKLDVGEMLLMNGVVVVPASKNPVLLNLVPADATTPEGEIDRVPFTTEELISLLNRAPTGFHSVANGHVLWANQTLLDILGYEPHEYIGHPVSKFHVDHSSMAPLIRRIKAGEYVRNYMVKLIAKDGSVRALLADSDAKFSEKGMPARSRAFFHYDVDRMVKEAIAAERISTLALLAAQKDRFIRTMFYAMRSPLQKLSSRFDDHMAHSELPSHIIGDMRHQIDLCSGLVEDLSFATMFDSDQVLHPHPTILNIKAELDTIFQHMRAVHAGEMEERRVRLSKMVSYDLPDAIVVDKLLIRAIINLVENAIKSCCAGGAVLMTIGFEEGYEDDGGRFFFTITNAVDCMVDIVRINKTFQSYFAPVDTVQPQMQVQQQQQPAPAEDEGDDLSMFSGSADSELSGSVDPSETQSAPPRPHLSFEDQRRLGLGLYVSYNIIQSLGGLLECDGNNHETCFTFSVAAGCVTSEEQEEEEAQPKEKPPTPTWSNVADSSISNQHVTSFAKTLEVAAEKQEHTSTEGSTARTDGEGQEGQRKVRVLVVDDSPICRKVFKRLLEFQGYTAEVACDGQEAVDRLEHVPCLFDLVLMDVHMPVMDGITAIQICRNRNHLKQLPIIVVTASPDEDVDVACELAGASHFMTKPLNSKELLNVIKRYTKN